MERTLFLLSVLLLALPSLAAEKPRVFITDSKSWEMAGGFAAWHQGSGSSDNYSESGGAAGRISGGARPQTAEVMKTFGEKCPEVIVTMKAEKASYVVLLEHEGGKKLLQKDNKVVVFNSDGDMIFSRSTRTLGGSVKDACEAIKKDGPGTDN